jgi:drug/metabolite transporter (DMT)-like permease
MPYLLSSPSLLALGAAALFGVTVHLANQSFRHLDVFTAARLTIAVTMLFFWALVPFHVPLADFFSPGVWVYVAIGVFQPVISLTLSFESTNRLGPTIAATVSSISPLFAMAGAVALLGEALTVTIFAGTLGVVAGVIVLSWRGATPRDWALAALLLPLATAAIRGFGNLATRYGMLLLPNAVLAGAVTYTVSMAVALVLHALLRHEARRPITWKGARAVVPTGVGNGCAMLLMILALKSGPVVVVTPILGSFPLFTLLLSLFWFRQETLNGRIVAGLLLIVPSIAMISLQR